MRRLAYLLLALLTLAAAPTSAAERGVTIGDACGPGPYYFCYSPPTLTVSSGDRVTWTNNSITPLGHTITRCTPAACGGVSGGTGTDSWPDSGTIRQGQTYSHAFTGAGTYVYYCTIHGYAQMHGTITVAGPSATPGPAVPIVSRLKLRKTSHARETLGFTLSAPAAVKIVVTRAGKTYRSKAISGRAGPNSSSFGTAGLRHGRYTVTVTPRGGKPARTSFAI
jgi:plastocyanin